MSVDDADAIAGDLDEPFADGEESSRVPSLLTMISPGTIWVIRADVLRVHAHLPIDRPAA